MATRDRQADGVEGGVLVDGQAEAVGPADALADALAVLVVDVEGDAGDGEQRREDEGGVTLLRVVADALAGLAHGLNKALAGLPGEERRAGDDWRAVTVLDRASIARRL